MPIPAAFVGIAGPGAIAAAKHMAIHAASYIDLYAFTSATFAALIAQMAWKRIPDWIKQDISFKSLVSLQYRNDDIEDDCNNNNNNNNEKTSRSRKYRRSSSNMSNTSTSSNSSDNSSDAREELSHMGSILEKLQDLVESAKVANPSSMDSAVPQLHAAVAAHIQLSGQLKLIQQEEQEELQRSNACDSDFFLDKEEKRGDEQQQKLSVPTPSITARDESYRNAGSPVAIEELQSKEHRDALQFATFAYYEDTNILEDKLNELDYTLLEHSWATRPGNVGYYVAISNGTATTTATATAAATATATAAFPTTKTASTDTTEAEENPKQIIIGVKGTSSLEDLLTDCCGNAVSFDDVESIYSAHFSNFYNSSKKNQTMTMNNMDDRKERIEVQAAKPKTIRSSSDGTNTGIEIINSQKEQIMIEDHDDDGDNYIRCHEGVLLCALRMVNKIQKLLSQQLHVHSANDVRDNDDNKTNYRIVLCGHSLGAGAAALAGIILRSRFPNLCNASTNTPNSTTKNRLQVYAFAPPPVLDHDTAIAASSFCTSFVNNADIIPRSSLANLMVFLEYIRHVHNRLVEENINPTGPRTTAAFLQKLAEGSGGTTLMTLEEVQIAMDAAYEKVELRKPYHLYIPGRVLLAYNSWSSRSSNGQVKRELGAQVKRDEGTSDDVVEKTPSTVSENCDEERTSDLECIAVDGTCKVLRTFEFDGVRMFTDHVTSSYFGMLGMDYEF